MLPSSAKLKVAVAACLLAAGGGLGCAQLPAIDPTGQHIFSGTTSLAAHEHGGLFHHKHRGAQPAAVAPTIVTPVVPAPVTTIPVTPVPVKPACQPPPVNVVPVVPVTPVAPVTCPPQTMAPMPLPAKPHTAGPVGQPPCPAPPGPELKVTPARLVAPVGTEVVLAAGLCAPNGYYVMRQPLEWMLAQDGVGQIVAIGHESPHGASYLLRHSPQKVATNYARAHTSTIEQTLDRGTPTPADDIHLDRGQSWISITSPTEGTSHVVVWAPKEQNWERRKTAAMIHWVDAAWKLPPPVTARGGNKQVLQTTLFRSSGQPIQGWTVRYEVLDGPPAAFGVAGERSIPVTTDAAGRATVELLPLSLQPGITTVRVQIIRPGTARGDLPDMVVGQGITTVQWTTPGLSVRAIGTSAVAADGAVSYRVEVTNNGDLPTRGVELSYTPPAGVTILNSSPPAQFFGQRCEWRLGNLPPRTTHVIELNCRASVAASVRSAFRATSVDGLAVEAAATTEVFHNALSVKMTGPDTVEVGREAKFAIEVTNTGESTLTGLVASDTFEAGLQERHGAKSPAVKAIERSLAPGETYGFALTFVATEPGRHCHRLSVTADGGHSAATQACVTAIAPIATPPQLDVRVTGSANARVGEEAQYTVEISNRGTGPATNVIVKINSAASLQLDRATPGFDHDPVRGTTQWNIARLPGGESITRQLVYQCAAADEGAIVRATVASQQTSTVTSEARTRIDGASARENGPAVRPLDMGAAARPLPDSDTPPGNDGLSVAIAATAGPVSIGETVEYLITIANQRGEPDRDVTVTVEVPEGLTVVRVPASPTPVLRSSAGSVEFTPIRELRPREQLPPIRLEVKGNAAGRYTLRVKVTSSRDPAGVSREAQATVAAP